MTREASPAFQFYPKDWLGSMNVRLMGAYGRGVHMDMLAHCWLEGHVPDDPKRVAALIGESSTAVKKVWNEVKKSYKPDPDSPGFLVHPRIEKERNKQKRYREKRSKAGQRGAEARWQSHSDRIDLPMAKNSSSSSSSISSPPAGKKNLELQGASDEKLTGPPPEVVAKLEAMFRDPGERPEHAGRTTSIPKDETAQHAEAVKFLNTYFPNPKPGAGLAPSVRVWIGRISEHRLIAAIREMQAGRYQDNGGPELTWRDLDDAARKKVILATLNPMAGEAGRRGKP